MSTLTQLAAASAPLAPETARATETGDGPLQSFIQLGSPQLVADEPGALGGGGTGPGPYDLLSAALATCTSMTIRVFARRKDWPLEQISVLVTHSKVALGPGPDGAPQAGSRDRFEVAVTLTGSLDDAQRQRLMDIANHCPVHRTLEAGSEVLVSRAA